LLIWPPCCKNPADFNFLSSDTNFSNSLVFLLSLWSLVAFLTTSLIFFLTSLFPDFPNPLIEVFSPLITNSPSEFISNFSSLSPNFISDFNLSGLIPTSFLLHS